MNNQLDLSKSIRRYQVNLYPKDDFNLGWQQLFRAKNKYQLKCQLMEQWLLWRLKEIFV